MIVKFETLEIEPTEVPNIDQLRGNFNSCLESAEVSGASDTVKAKEFLIGGVKLLKSPKIKVLKITDLNTTGLIGPSIRPKPFFAFMKSNGVSEKSNSTASGSFGIGKYAPFAASHLRTVFVSTTYLQDEKTPVTLSQGKAVLTSFKKDEATHRGTGYWGVTKGYEPLQGASVEQLPVWLQRDGSFDGIGTSIYILAVKESEGWLNHLASAIVESYFAKILSKKLIIQIDDLKIDHSNIENFFNDLIEKLNDQDELSQNNLKKALEYFKCLQDGTNQIIGNVDGLGECTLHLRVEDKLPKKICVVRNGMVITDKLNVQGLKNFSVFKDFIAVFECNSRDGQELLRGMEPPSHDDFQPDRLPQSQQKAAKVALKKLSEWIRDVLKQRATNPTSDETLIDEINELLPGDGTASEQGLGAEINPTGKIKITTRVIKPSITTSKPKKPGEDQPGPVDGDPSPTPPTQPPTPLPPGSPLPTPTGGRVTAPKVTDFRVIPINLKRKKIFFTCNKQALLKIKVLAVGNDDSEDLYIHKVNTGTIENNIISLNNVSAGRVELEIELTSTYDGAMGIEIVEEKE